MSVEDNITVVVIDDEMFKEYIESINQKALKPVLFGNYSKIIYASGSRKSYSLNKYYTSLKDKPSITIVEVTWDDEKYETVENYSGDKEKLGTITDYYISNKEFFSSALFSVYEHPVVIMNEELAKKYNINCDDLYYNTFIKANDNNK